MPGMNTGTFWWVKALDRPRDVQGYYSPIGSFQYRPGQVTPTSPLSGAVVDIPTLTWQPKAGAVRYRVRVTWAGGEMQAETHSTSWTPTGTAKLDPAKGTFRWTVQAIDVDNRVTPLPLFYDGETFTISGNTPTTGAAPLTPLAPTAVATQRFPALTWEPLAGAAYYRVFVARSGFGFSQVASTFPYAAGTDLTAGFLGQGSYDWLVRAYDASGNVLPGSGATGEYLIADAATVTGQRVALNGSGLAGGASPCSKSLLTPTPQICTGMTGTPVLDWQPVPTPATTSSTYPGTATSRTWSTAHTPTLRPSRARATRDGSPTRPCRTVRRARRTTGSSARARRRASAPATPRWPTMRSRNAPTSS